MVMTTFEYEFIKHWDWICLNYPQFKKRVTRYGDGLIDYALSLIKEGEILATFICGTEGSIFHLDDLVVFGDELEIKLGLMPNAAEVPYSGFFMMKEYGGSETQKGMTTPKDAMLGALNKAILHMESR
jgi:hypothetical protein